MYAIRSYYAFPARQPDSDFSFDAGGSRITFPDIGPGPGGDTTVVDAYLNPVLRRYVAQLRESLGDESDRITSYNVCYTKLLRGFHHQS